MSRRSLPGILFVLFMLAAGVGAGALWGLGIPGSQRAGAVGAVCGDGIINWGEHCEDGNTANGDGCNSLCKYECAAASDCTPLTGIVGACFDSGAGYMQTGVMDSDCDAGYCPSTTVPCATEFGLCADGNDNDDDSLTDCADSDCNSASACGGTETACTDHLDNDFDGSTDCADSDCAGNPACGGGGTCPNGILDAGETCDDNNANNNDGCSDACQTEPGWTCVGQPSVCQKCGNGIKEGTEQCDDGATVDGDGCSATCQNEPPCDNDGSCNAGGGETCANCAEDCGICSGGGGDACDAFCRKTYCGDGIVQSPNGDGILEECDGTALCSPGCRTVSAGICGNGIREGLEACDDGKRCSGNGDLCQFNNDCPSGQTCVGMNIDGCTTPGGGGGGGGGGTRQCNNGVDDDSAQGIDCADPDCTSGVDWVRYVVDAAMTSTTQSLKLINVDGDSDLDIVAVNGGGGFFSPTGEVLWYESNGAMPPVFAGHSSFGGAIYTTKKVMIDAGAINDEDSFVDVVSGGGAQLDWFRNDGAQSFARTTIPTSLGSNAIAAVHIVDWNGDGRKDILVAASNGLLSGVVNVYENDGNESFTERTLVSDVPGVGFVHPADVNADGKLDIVAPYGSTLAWYRNVDNGTVPFPLGGTIDSSLTAASAASVANITSDSNPDVIVGDGGKIRWYKGDGAGGFTQQPDVGMLDSVNSVAAADLDGDGDADIVAAHGLGAGGSGLSAYRSSGGASPTFSAQEVIIGVDVASYVVRTGNLKNDGDVVVVGGFQENGSTFRFVEWYDFAGAGQCYPLDDSE